MLRPLYHLMRADFLERVRRYSFLLTLVFAIGAAYAFVPPNNANYSTLRMGEYRGLYNSAWIGTLVAMMSEVFLSLAGFYLVKNAVSRDRQTGVGQIIATTPISRFQYLTGKTLSNFAVLAAILVVLTVATAGMQLFRGEDIHIQPLTLIAPFVFITLPVMCVVAAVAVLFETIPLLRGGFGNVVFFFGWIPAVATDLYGMQTTISQMQAACERAFPAFHAAEGKLSMGFIFYGDQKGAHALQTFRWDGIDWTASVIAGRLLWLAAALGIVFVASLFFDRFDPSRGKRVSAVASVAISGVKPRQRLINPLLPRILETCLVRPLRAALGPVAFAELRLMLGGLKWWWYLVATGLFIAGLSSPTAIGREFLLPIAWFWPVLIWSPLGTREKRFGTDQMIFVSTGALRRQFPAMWVAGVTVALLTGGGVLLRLAIAANWPAVLAGVAGALFVPSLALALGVWSGTGKLFEVIYTLLWYGGPMNKAPFLDYIGVTDVSINTGIYWKYLLCSAVLLGLAFLGRRRQMQN